MAIILGGVTLSPHMIWEDENDYSTVDQTAVRTLGGNVLVYAQQLTKGLPITLVAVEDQGWLTKLQVQAVQALANAAGDTYGLTLGSQNFTVVFRHHEPPAFAARALIPRVETTPADYYTATIKLMTV
jgi:hypothetical protein